MQHSSSVHLLFSLHSSVLLRASDTVGRHFQGLGQISRCKELSLSSRARRKIRDIDAAFNIIRHITSASAASFLELLDNELAAARDAVVPPAPGSSARSHHEPVVMNMMKATLCVTHGACGQDLPAEDLLSSSGGVGGNVEAVAAVPVALGRANDMVGELPVNDSVWGVGGQSSALAVTSAQACNLQEDDDGAALESAREELLTGSRVQTHDDAVFLEDDDKVGALVNEWETWSHRGGSAGFVFQPSTSSPSLLPSTSSSTSSPDAVDKAAFCAAMGFSQDKLGSMDPPAKQCPTQ